MYFWKGGGGGGGGGIYLHLSPPPPPPSNLFMTPHLCLFARKLKSIRVHLSPGSSCGLVAYTLHNGILFFMGHTAIF